MRYKLLGRSGLRVSEVCLGTMSFGNAWGFGADEAESRRMIAAFAEAGGNFIDTANKYHDGQSETYVGRAIAADRARWVLATKYALAMRPDDPNAAGNARKNLVQSVEQSLRRLGTDYVDLLWVHAWDFTTPVAEVMRGLDDLVRQGKVLYVGISDTPAWVVAEANTLAELRGWTPFVGLQLAYSLIERTAERELLPMAGHFGLGVTAWAPVGGGVLTGKYTRGDGPPADSRRAHLNESRLTERNLRIGREVDAIADELGATSGQVALSWLRQQSAALVPVVGPRTLPQMQDLLGCLDVRLDPAHLRRLDALSRIERGFPHDFMAEPASRSALYGPLEAQIDLPPAALLPDAEAALRPGNADA